MFEIRRQEYTAQFEELAVRRLRRDQRIGAVARELGLTEQTLRNGLKAAKAGKLNPPGTKAIAPEHMELSRVRAEHARLRLENEIIKNDGAPRERCHVKYAWIDTQGHHFPLPTMCTTLAVSIKWVSGLEARWHPGSYAIDRCAAAGPAAEPACEVQGGVWIAADVSGAAGNDAIG